MEHSTAEPKGQNLLPALVLEPQHQPATASVIWLHGLGADGYDFEPLVPQLELDDLPIRWIFPHAPQQAVTINGGMRMPAWYDIRALDITAEPDLAGIQASCTQVQQWIAAEQQRGIPRQRILLAGFSQGGAIALETLVTATEPLAGVLALSAYLPLQAQLAAHPPTETTTPIWIGHGRADTVVPLVAAEASYALLKTHYPALTWHTYPMAHSLCAEEIGEIAAWLRERLS